MKNDYVINHDFGYGYDKEFLNKLNLRNIIDVEDYLNEIAENIFNATYKNNILQFKNDKFKINIEKEN